MAVEWIKWPTREPRFESFFLGGRALFCKTMFTWFFSTAKILSISHKWTTEISVVAQCNKIISASAKFVGNFYSFHIWTIYDRISVLHSCMCGCVLNVQIIELQHMLSAAPVTPEWRPVMHNCQCRLNKSWRMLLNMLAPNEFQCWECHSRTTVGVREYVCAPGSGTLAHWELSSQSSGPATAVQVWCAPLVPGASQSTVPSWQRAGFLDT